MNEYRIVIERRADSGRWRQVQIVELDLAALVAEGERLAANPCEHRCQRGRDCGGCGCEGCGYSRTPAASVPPPAVGYVSGTTGRAAPYEPPHCRTHLQFRSDCAACVAEREADLHP